MIYYLAALKRYWKSYITLKIENSREVAERLKAHAWKVCKPKGFEGSNPFLSANDKAPVQGLFYWLIVRRDRGFVFKVQQERQNGI